MGRLLTRGATSIVLAAAGLSASVAAWSWLGGAPLAHPHQPALSPGGVAAAAAMWQAMMIAMMTPAVAPWVGLYARLDGERSAARATLASLTFASGYFAIWLGYSLAAALLQVGLGARGGLGSGESSPLVAGGILIAAGAYQFAPLKRACLTHCRNPMSFLVARWQGGPPSPFRLGLTHGAYCVGCCWLLMLTAFAVGLMNLAWMALLTVGVGLEQIAPGGVWLGRVGGAALIAWGALLAWPA